MQGYVLPLIGDVPLSDLKPSDVRGLQAELLTKGRPRGGPEPRRGVPSKHVPLKPKTVKNILGGSLRAMLNAARGDELLPRDVFADHPWPKVVTPEPDPFAPDERTRILQWFAEKTFRLPAPGTMRLIAWPHPAYHAFLHLLFWTGMRPSEAAGLQWGDIELTKDRLHVRRSRYLWEYGEPKTTSARRTVRLFPETVWLLRALMPLHVTPGMPVFTNTRGTAIEPNSLLPHWYDAQRALGIRVRGLYCTKDTFVSAALEAGVKIAWLETQTGVSYATLRRHYGRWMPTEGASELLRFESLAPTLFTGPECVRPAPPTDTEAKRRSEIKALRVRKGGLEPPRVLPHRILNPARLPIPPLSRASSAFGR